VGEGTARPIRVIQSNAANQIRIVALNALNRRENNSYVSESDSTIAIQIVHPTVAIVVDNHVCRITELMTTVSRATTLVTKSSVVVRCSEAGDDFHSAGAHTVSLEILNHQLELVEQRLAKDDVLRPDIFLIVRQKILQLEMR
jgi:hypothetical protein